MQQHGQQIMQASFADDSGSIKEPLSSVAISSRPKQRYAENQAPGWVDDPYKHKSPHRNSPKRRTRLQCS
jgi:hypothetical protein